MKGFISSDTSHLISRICKRWVMSNSNRHIEWAQEWYFEPLNLGETMNDEGLLLGRTKNEFDWSSWRSIGLEIHAIVEARETINT